MKADERLNAGQFAFLEAFSNAVSNDVSQRILVWDIGRKLFWDEATTRKVMHNLARRDLIHVAGTGGLYTITAEGVRVVSEMGSERRVNN